MRPRIAKDASPKKDVPHYHPTNRDGSKKRQAKQPSLAQGAGEIVLGVAAVSGGSGEAVLTAPACGTGVGCAAPAVGVGTVVAGAVVATHGTLVTVNTINNIFSKNNSETQNSSQQPYENTPQNQERMQQGKPIGKDGKPVELHHNNQRPNSGVREMTRADHRGRGNYTRNHPNRGPSRIDRNKAASERRKHWKNKAKEENQ